MDRNAEHGHPHNREPGTVRSDLSNIHVREDLARAGRCANVHLATGRTCLLPLRHYGPCEFHNPQEAEDILRG
ncbi:hypothetical protein [Arthrobacter sp. S39]|uniref:hypothetical protein n=1 Tax=Arthrobacter sp. S39 TaxID=2509720 RepID=UPI001037736D|nr:hypothetical protein [Arthrobacter sp. S39]TAP45030.1 hypothetical protein EYS21_05980 [Arthrobacter sp. S39]